MNGWIENNTNEKFTQNLQNIRRLLVRRSRKNIAKTWDVMISRDLVPLIYTKPFSVRTFCVCFIKKVTTTLDTIFLFHCLFLAKFDRLILSIYPSTSKIVSRLRILWFILQLIWQGTYATTRKPKGVRVQILTVCV